MAENDIPTGNTLQRSPSSTMVSQMLEKYDQRMADQTTPLTSRPDRAKASTPKDNQPNSLSRANNLSEICRVIL